MSNSPISDRDTSFFDTIKERVPLEDYLRDHCGVEFVSDGPGRLAACCPFHEERTPSFKVKEADEHSWQVWRCYGGCAGSEIDRGTVIDAVMKREAFSESMDAARWLNEEYDLGLAMNTEAYKRFQEIRQKARGRIEEGQRELEKGDSTAAKAAKSYFEKRGFSDETAAHFGLGVDTEMTKAGRLSIPLFDKENHPVSVDGRALFDSHPCRACGQKVQAKDVFERRFKAKKAEERGEEPDFDWTSCPHCSAPDQEARVKWLASQHPKYRFEKGLDKSKLLYHQFEAKRALVRDGRKGLAEQELHGLFLTEGYADCWAAWQAGQHSVCAYNGSVLSAWQAKQAVEVAMGSGTEPKPVILVPDMDATGRLNVERNIRMLRGVNPAVEIQVIMGLDFLSYKDDAGEEHACKDLGEVLQHHGVEAVARLLHENRRPAEEWIIRGILDAKLVDGQPFHSKLRQMELIAEVLQGVRHKSSLDHLVPLLAEHWDLRETEARRWFQMNHSKETTASHQDLISDIYDAREDALIFLKHGHVIPTGYAAIDRCLPRGGVRKGWLAMFLGKSGTGKAQPLDARVLTPSGWREMGEIQVGDEVINPEGGTARVIGVFPQGERDIYRVQFSDGSSTECDLEHLWTIRDQGKWYTRTLRQLLDPDTLQPKRAFFIPMPRDVDLEEKEPLPLDPYLMGVLLGDGSFRNGNLMLSNNDEELILAARERLPEGVALKKVPGDNNDWRISCGKRGGHNAVGAAIKATELWNLYSHEKFIPAAFKHTTAANRLELLRGLMDADGCVRRRKPKKRHWSPSIDAVFVTASMALASDVVDLVRSLGGTAQAVTYIPTYRRKGEKKFKKGREAYRVVVSMPRALNPFRMSSKAGKWDRRREPTRRLVEVEFVGTKQAQCIALDSENQLYITDDWVCSHNTMMSTQLLSNMAEHGTRAIFFSLEQKKGQLYERIACQVLGKPPSEVEDIILAADDENDTVDPKFREQCKKELEEVDRIFGNENLFIVDNVPTETVEAVEMTAERIESIIREVNMTRFKNGAADVVIIDHLGILKAGSEAPRNVQSDELQAAGYIMERLFHVCKATDVFLLVLQQLPKEIPAGVAFAKDAGRGGSKQTDYCDIIFGAWRPEQEAGIEEDEKAARRGQYKLALLKNRYGAEEIAHLTFDSNSLRIIPAARVPMPDDDIADEPRVAIPEDGVEPAGVKGNGGNGGNGGQDPLTAGLTEGEGEIDTHQLAASLGLVEESEDGEQSDSWEWS